MVGLAEDGRPGEEKGDFDIEDDEQQGDNVEAEVELDEPGADGDSRGHDPVYPQEIEADGHAKKNLAPYARPHIA